MPANQLVIVVRTFVVCAPKIFSVTPPPKAAPSPSLFGRCIRMTNIMSTATSPCKTSRMLITIDIGTGNMARVAALSTRSYSRRRDWTTPGRIARGLKAKSGVWISDEGAVSAHWHLAVHPHAIHNTQTEHDHQSKRTAVA